MSPAEILNRNFTRAFRGYDAAEVDGFLEALARELDGLQTQLRDLDAQRVDHAEAVQWRAMEHELAEAIVASRHAASEVVARAEERAAAIVREGEAQRDAVVAGATREVDELRSERDRLGAEAGAMRAELAAWQEGLEEVRAAYEDFSGRIAAFAAGVRAEADAAVR